MTNTRYQIVDTKDGKVLREVNDFADALSLARGFATTQMCPIKIMGNTNWCTAVPTDVFETLLYTAQPHEPRV
jgi:Tfp pilus assembly protein FimT